MISIAEPANHATEQPWLRVEDGVLQVGVDCSGCSGGKLELTVPAAVELSIALRAGDASLAFDPQAPLEQLGVEVGTSAVDLRVPAGGWDLPLQAGVGEVQLDDLQHQAGADRRSSVEVGTGIIDVRGH